jgi:predicted enzyme related to lactoylglutathione lyase
MMEKRVTAFGGVFFKCQDKKALIEWYKKHLGIPLEDWGAIFPFSDAVKMHPNAYNVFSPFPSHTNYFEPSSSNLMFNFIVEDLDSLVSVLKSEGIEPLAGHEASEFGKFTWILDCEGNKTELWEPSKA